MDNNEFNEYNQEPRQYPRQNSQRPRKRVSKETFRKRQFAALCVIAFLVLLFVILMAKACSKKPSSDSSGGDAVPAESQTTDVNEEASTEDPAATTTVTTTTTAPVIDPSKAGAIKLDKYTVYLEVGQAPALALITEHPDGMEEADEVWSSDHPEIATVDEWGHISAVSPGTCYVTVKSAKDPSLEATVKVVVAGEPSLEQTANNTTTTTTTKEPQSARAEAPAPSKINDPKAHYEGDVLIVNKSYSLSSDYNPGGLDPTCSEWFNKLVQGAAEDGINIYLSSGFRSYDYQSQIYNNYVGIYGQDTADTFSARPGHSEHQTGLAIDVNIIDDSFRGTPEAEWIAAHCYEYGFILRYPEGKQSITGYKYEPWHIRYVGTEISYALHDIGPDATLEEYYGIDSKY